MHTVFYRWHYTCWMAAACIKFTAFGLVSKLVTLPVKFNTEEGRGHGDTGISDHEAKFFSKQALSLYV